MPPVFISKKEVDRSGKTTFGKAIAERLGRPFIDADDYLEEKEGRTIASLFAISEDGYSTKKQDKYC